MRLDKLEAIHTTLERMGRRILIDENFDVKTILTAIIVILKEMTEYEISKNKIPSTHI